MRVPPVWFVCVIFPWGIPQLQSDWSLSCDHGLDYASFNVRTTTISQLTQFMPPPEKYKNEIGSQPTMCQVHTGANVSLLAPVEKMTKTPLATQERLPRIYCIEYLSLRIRTTDASQMEPRNKRGGVPE